MPHVIRQLNEKTLGVTIRGVLSEADLAAMQDAARALIATARKINVLIILRDFTGLEPGKEFGDVDFYAEHGDDIARMAIVGDPKWKEWAAMFTGSGLRATKVGFYPFSELEQAQAWVLSA